MDLYHAPAVVRVCPYSIQDSDPAAAVDTANFYLKHTEGGIKLSTTHAYYYQIQGQLPICDRPYCDLYAGLLVACILKESHEIPAMMWDKIQPTLDLFYVKLILCSNATSIVDESSCSSTQQSSEQVEQLYCICRNVEEGLMVGCDNDCPYECFHIGCVGLDCIPQGEWYCADLCQSNQLNLIKL